MASSRCWINTWSGSSYSEYISILMNTRNESYTRVHRLSIRHARSTIVIRPYHFLDFVNPAAAEVTTADEAKQLLSGPSPLPLSPSLMFSARSSQLVPCQEWVNLWTLPWQVSNNQEGEVQWTLSTGCSVRERHKCAEVCNGKILWNFCDIIDDFPPQIVKSPSTFDSFRPTSAQKWRRVFAS